MKLFSVGYWPIINVNDCLESDIIYHRYAAFYALQGTVLTHNKLLYVRYGDQCAGVSVQRPESLDHLGEVLHPSVRRACLLTLFFSGTNHHHRMKTLYLLMYFFLTTKAIIGYREAVRS